MQLRSGVRTLDLSTPQVMGILNVTPDSFSDGGKFNHLETALIHAEAMLKQGASLIDVGGESTRPGAADVPVEQELERVIPVIEKITANLDVWVSVDTSKAQVMTAAAEAGAHLINDVRALQDEGALEAAAETRLPVCLMHMQGQPRTMQNSPKYADLLTDISAFFRQRVDECQAAGIGKEKIVLDPGFGFGKTVDHNFHLLSQFGFFTELGMPLLAGLSRKSMFGHLLEREAQDRLAASLAGALLCAQQGAAIIRVHDVVETVDVIKVLEKAKQFSG